MAVAGRKPKPIGLRLVTGNPGRRPINTAAPEPKGRPKPPVPLAGRPLALWRQYIARAFWLTASDSFTAYMFVTLASEFEESGGQMQAARISNLRALASSLGLDPASRARLAADVPASDDKATSHYFQTR